jgi:secreted trypsin-like serine protease
LALVAAAPHSEDRQKWRPAQGRDLSKFKPKLPEVAFGTATPTAPRTKSFEFKKGNKSFSEECGLENPNGIADRIVGGHEAAHHEWPWQVALFVDDAWFCGGSLISDEWVMTAAHCAEGAGYFDVMAGAHNVRDSSEPHRIEITSFEGQTHPDWDPSSLYADIALVHLPEKIAFSEYIRPSCLPPASDATEEYVGQLTTPVGWGKNADDAGGITPDLNMVEDLPVITPAACADYYGDLIYSGIMCIDAAGGKGVCNGDSGGTLNIRQTEGGNKWTQVGVTSFVSSAGCESGNPHGFSRVAEHLEWIETVTGLSLTQ